MDGCFVRHQSRSRLAASCGHPYTALTDGLGATLVSARSWCCKNGLFSITVVDCRVLFPRLKALSGFHPGSIILPHFRSDNGSYFDFLPSFGPVYCSAKTPSLTICARFLISFFHCLLFTSTPLTLVRPWPQRADDSENPRGGQGPLQRSAGRVGFAIRSKPTRGRDHR